MGSDLLKPYPARHQTTPAVERPCPAPKGLKLLERILISLVLCVERPCPAPKGLKRTGIPTASATCGRKTLPCSKGIETQADANLSQLTFRRKTLPCSKGIETSKKSESECNSLCRKTPPCSKGIETELSLLGGLEIVVERPCPVPKGLRLKRP